MIASSPLPRRELGTVCLRLSGPGVNNFAKFSQEAEHSEVFCTPGALAEIRHTFNYCWLTLSTLVPVSEATCTFHHYVIKPTKRHCNQRLCNNNNNNYYYYWPTFLQFGHSASTIHSPLLSSAQYVVGFIHWQACAENRIAATRRLAVAALGIWKAILGIEGHVAATFVRRLVSIR